MPVVGGGGGRQPSGGQHTILPNFPKKLHEIERIWTPGGHTPLSRSIIFEFFLNGAGSRTVIEFSDFNKFRESELKHELGSILGPTFHNLSCWSMQSTTLGS